MTARWFVSMFAVLSRITFNTGATDGSLYRGFGPEAGFGNVSAVKLRHLSCKITQLGVGIWYV